MPWGPLGGSLESFVELFFCFGAFGIRFARLWGHHANTEDSLRFLVSFAEVEEGSFADVSGYCAVLRVALGAPWATPGGRPLTRGAHNLIIDYCLGTCLSDNLISGHAWFANGTGLEAARDALGCIFWLG